MISFLKKGFIYLFVDREEGSEKERKRNNQCLVASEAPHTHTGDLACNPGMCPDWESNQQPFGLQAGTQSTEPHQPGLELILIKYQYLPIEREEEESRNRERKDGWKEKDYA